MKLLRFFVFNLTFVISAPLTFISCIQIVWLKERKTQRYLQLGDIYLWIRWIRSNGMINPPLLSKRSYISFVSSFLPGRRALRNIHTYYSRFSDPGGIRKFSDFSEYDSNTGCTRFVARSVVSFNEFTDDVRR